MELRFNRKFSMELTEFSPRFCPCCGEPKNEIKDGVEIIKRCTCDWERGFHDRVRKTIHYSFWRDGVVTIKDWSPPLFKDGGPGRFKTFIKIQKAVAIHKLYDFCFKFIGKTPENKKVYALDKNMERGRSFYIRGPLGSGRGTLLSQIKFFAAFRDISTTPNPADWATFKSEIAQCNWNGKEAEIAKDNVSDQYRQVKLLTLENVKGEESKFPFKGASLIDDLLTKRNLNHGCNIFTSSDFVGQLGNLVGDRLPEILMSEGTSIVLLFHPTEADALLNAVIRRRIKLEDIIAKCNFGQSKTHQDSLQEDKNLELVKELLYINEAFGCLPLSLSLQSVSKLQTESLVEQLGLKPEQFHEKIQKVWAAFGVSKEEKGLEYEEALKRVYISVIKECPELGNRMTEKEMIETGKMIRLACSEKDVINKYINDAQQLREKMFNE